MNFLVVDDSKLARLSIIKSLNENVDNAAVSQAENGQEALDKIKSENIDVVFLDLTMPVMDGYEALPLMLESNPQIKVVVVSADIQPKAQERVMGLGAVMHTKKPINSEKMKDILSKL